MLGFYKFLSFIGFYIMVWFRKDETSQAREVCFVGLPMRLRFPCFASGYLWEYFLYKNIIPK